MLCCSTTKTVDVKMPEKKRVSIAPDSKGDGKKKQEAKPNGDKRDGAKSSNVNPIQRSKEGIKRSYDVRKARGKYDDTIKNVVDEQESDRKYLVEQIQIFKVENNKLIRQQTNTFGLTIDEMKSFEAELEHSKSTNAVLYHELEARKEECDKLQEELDSLTERLNGLTLDKYDLLHDKRMHKSELIQLQQLENKVGYLIKDNKALRLQLMTNKIDPNADASKITSVPNTISMSSPKSDISHRQTRGSRFPAVNNRIKNPSPKSERAYYDNVESGEPVVWTRKRLMKYKSMDDIRPAKESGKKTHLQRSRTYNSQTMPSNSFRGKQGNALSLSNNSRKGVWA